MKKNITLIFLLIIIRSSTVLAQYRDTIFNTNIASLQISRSGLVFSNPIIHLGSSDQLSVVFDEFGSKSNFYHYTLLHCNADWNPSDLLKNEYLEPYTNEPINEVLYSNNTIKDYVQYQFSFPNENIQITKSGNYILTVYAEDEQQPVFFKKIYVVEPTSVPISATIKQATDLSDKLLKQEVDITISKIGITNSSKVKLFIQQNGRSDNLISLSPTSTSSDQIIYDYDKENVFDGGSEFRTFDVKSIRYKLDHVQILEMRDNGPHAFLYPDKQRRYQAYESLTDINGRQFFKTEDYDNQMAAEYVWVHFFIPMPQILELGKLYIFGELTQWKFLPEAEMTYNSKLSGYQGAIYVKQGLYNYQYLFLKQNAKMGQVEIIEGNHWETENEYSIFVYYRPDGAIADKLIGAKIVKFNK